LIVAQGQSQVTNPKITQSNVFENASNTMEQSDAVQRLKKLTDKQREVLTLVVQRKTSKQIARILGISKPAVDQRIASARDTLAVASRDDAALLFMQANDTYHRVIYDPAQLHKNAEPSPKVIRERGDIYEIPMEESTNLNTVYAEKSPSRIGNTRHLLLDKLSGENRIAIRSLLIMVLSICMMALVLIGLSVSEVLSRLISSS
jgi:DNA-binding CsgD family transcriptional regulator